MPCHRCQSLMFPVDLLDEAGGLLHQHLAAWRCFACGDILDTVIVENRSRSRRGDVQQPNPQPRPRRLVGVSR
jgi:hypothetical protein